MFLHPIRRPEPSHPDACSPSQVLDSPGSSDLSVWVDFDALRQAALESMADVECHGPITQAQFLQAMGIQARLEQLQKASSLCLSLYRDDWYYRL
jgi:SAM-dependent MidA family methyltransferase